MNSSASSLQHAPSPPAIEVSRAGNRRSSPLRVTANPRLDPRMIWKRGHFEDPPFPFNRPGLRYYYLGRNAIHDLVRIWDLKDQEVLFPAYCHGVELAPLLAAGVRVRFYPVHAGMRVDAEQVLRLISRHTRAVYLTHYCGFPGPVFELNEICRERGLLLVEDCALALLSQAGNRPLGSVGDAAVFCLYKMLPLPHGGALLLRERVSLPEFATVSPPAFSTLAYAASAVFRNLSLKNNNPAHRLMQRVKNAAQSLSGGLGVVPVGGVQFDPRQVRLAMSGLCRRVLANQDYPAIVERRRRNYEHLWGRLAEVAPAVTGELTTGVCPLFYAVQTGNKLALQRQLLERGIETVNLWSLVPPAVPEGMFPEVDVLRRTILELPCHQDLTLEEMDSMADTVLDIWRPM